MALTAGSSPSGAAAVPQPVGLRVRGFVALTKPRIIQELLITTVPPMIVAEQGLPRLSLILCTVIGGTLAAGGANAFNMVIDRDIDAVMHRTRNRPLVTGVVNPNEALVFAFAIEVAAFVLLWTTVNLLSALLALAACLFYVGVYTLWLKRTSVENIVIGGAAGAAPVLVGWAAVTGSLGWAPWLLFLVIFFWTPPHFWALAIRYKDDYAAADVPMLPSVASLATTTAKMLVYTVLMLGSALAFGVAADLGTFYLVASSVLGLVFLAFNLDLARRVRRGETAEVLARPAMRFFSYSITYVTLLFVVMAADVLLRSGW
jgi:protoheme IX farnesyltransferase